MSFSFPTLDELHKMPINELESVSNNIRTFLIQQISKTGGHIGANLAVIELFVSLHHVFDSPNDKIIVDTGHQGYVHKILTGRSDLFHTLNTFLGMNRFLTRQESVHDTIDATHAGTALSTAAGIAKAFQLDNSTNKVIAIVGDGTLVEGLTFEGLNFLAVGDLPVIIIINDNEMAIAPNIGGIKNLTRGKTWMKKCANFFQGLGFDYFPIENGHDVKNLVNIFEKVKTTTHPTIIHIKTEKGKGMLFAKNHPYKMHFSMPFDPITGDGASPTISGKTFASVSGEKLYSLLKSDKNLIVMTPATPYASSLDSCLRDFPQQVIDVGMAEQHIVSMACGLSLSGKKPVVCFQTTFMQRAFDQILHDVCFMNLPVTILGVRSGFAGYDGPTHHGLYDIPYLRSLPNLQIIYPLNSDNLSTVLTERLNSPKGPMVILCPYDQITEPELKLTYEEDGFAFDGVSDVGYIICLNNTMETAKKITSELLSTYNVDFGIICIQKIKPLQKNRINELCKSKKIIVIEESTLPGGLGSLICETLSDDANLSKILRIGVPDKFIPGGNKLECSNFCGLTPEYIIPKILKCWPTLFN